MRLQFSTLYCRTHGLSLQLGLQLLNPLTHALEFLKNLGIRIVRRGNKIWGGEAVTSSGPARAVSCSCPLVCARAFGGFKKDMANATTRPSLKPHLNRSVNSFVCILVFPIAYVFDLQQVSDDMTVTAIFA